MIRMIMELFRNQSFILTIGDSKQSRLLRLKKGVPQVSALAALIFNIYTYNLLSTISRKFSYKKYLTLLHSSSSFRRRRLKGIHSRSDTNRIGAEGLSFYYPRLLYCLDQMLAVMSLSQHRVSSSKTVRPRAPCGSRFIGHAVSTWSVVCSEAPHSQFGEGVRPHLCMNKWNRPTPVRRRLVELNPSYSG